MSTYAVGVLSSLLTIGRALTVPELKVERANIIRREWTYLTGYLARQARKGNWRAVRNSFNGYLCEHDAHPHDAGRGWTKRAAERRADRLCEVAMGNTLAEWWPRA